MTCSERFLLLVGFPSLVFLLLEGLTSPSAAPPGSEQRKSLHEISNLLDFIIKRIIGSICI